MAQSFKEAESWTGSHVEWQGEWDTWSGPMGQGGLGYRGFLSQWLMGFKGEGAEAGGVAGELPPAICCALQPPGLGWTLPWTCLIPAHSSALTNLKV